MSTLAEIQAATEALPLNQQEELYRLLGAKLHASPGKAAKARILQQSGDVLLEAPIGAPPMTPENVKHLLEDWP